MCTVCISLGCCFCAALGRNKSTIRTIISRYSCDVDFTESAISRVHVIPYHQ